MRLNISSINPTLLKVATEVDLKEISSGRIQDLIDNLIETKRAARGAGLAAPQVSVSRRIFVVEVDKRSRERYPYKPLMSLTVVINPRISFLTDKRMLVYEGCLSIPGLRGVVPRCPVIRVQGWARNGQPLDLQVRGVSAGTFQHEDDHVNGILFPTRVSDPATFCTQEEFESEHEHEFAAHVARVEKMYR